MHKFDKKLSEKILPKFNNAKEWSDLTTILKNLKENFKKYNSFDMHKITDKVLLSKRLAQALNPSLPGGLHEITLEVYDMLFENIRTNNNNFIGVDLGLYCSGLFPFFQFASVPNKIFYLDKIIKKHFLEFTDQELSLCLPGFLASILPGFDEQNDTIVKLLKDIFTKARSKVTDEVFFGALWSVMLRTQRLRLVGLKYIIEAIPTYKYIEENIEQIDEIIQKYYPNINVLVINSLTSMIEDDSNVQVQRLSLDFVTTRLPIANKILNQEQKVALVISALNLLIKNEYTTTRRLLAWLMGNNQEDELEMGDPIIKYMIELVVISIKKIFDKKNSTKEKLNNGIKIIDQLFKQQVKLVDYILEHISIDLIICVDEYWHNIGNNNNSDEIIIKVKKFFDYDQSYLDCLWNSLGKLLHNAVNYQGENKLNEIHNAIKLLKLCLAHIQLEAIEKKTKFYIPIISSLLKALLSYKVDRDNLSDLKSPLVLALKFSKDLQETSNNNSETQNRKYSVKQILKQNEQNYSLLESFKENIILYQSFYIKICQLFLNEFSQTEEETIAHQDMKIFKQATELILRIQEFSFQDIVPEWVSFLIKIVFSINLELSLEGIYYLLDLLMITSENEVYNNIKLYLRSEEIGQDYLSKNLVFQTHIQRNSCELSMAKLWILLDQQNHQKKVIDLLIKFYKAEPQVFSNTISNTFAINDLDQNVNAIRKFSQFWKLTSEYYPELIFFENGECIFKMLDFLDHEHPLLRHLSKSWLSQSVGQFNKILDPLLKVLLDKETSWYISPKKQLYFAKEYDNRRIIEAFRKLKNIIINMTDLAISYFVTQPISPVLLDMDDTGRELSSVSRSIPMEHYLELMVSISLRFIQGKFIESVSQSFYRENFSVNAASCEFLEFLLSFIEPKSKVMNIAEMIAEPVLLILHENIMNNDEVMQVQLLNLLKVLLFNTQGVHKDFLQQAVNIFNSQLLHDCINCGIQINYIFVRSHFISFLEMCLPIFRDILDQDSNLRIANKLLITTSDFLVRRVKYYNKYSNISEDDKSDLKKLNHMEQNPNSRYFLVKNYLEEYKEFKTFDENDVNVIIKGLKQILFHFMNIENSISSVDKINWPEFKKMSNAKPNSTSFKDYLGGLFSSSKFEENVNRKNISAISIEIFNIFEDVLASFICCWVNESDSYMTKDLCLNENGILAYNLDEIRFQNSVNEELTSMNNSSKNFSGNGKGVKTTKLLKSQIVHINFNLFLSNPYDYMNKFMALWLNEKNRYIFKDKQYKLSMIELLVAMNLPVEVVLNAIIKNINVQKIKEFKKSKAKIKDVYPFYLNKDNCTYEAKLCHLMYSYLIFNTNLKVDKSIVEIWNEIINFLTIFLESKAPSTFLWVYEILNIMLYKLPIRETVSQDRTIKHRLTQIITNLFTKTMEMSINNKIDVLFDEPSQIILPMSPSIYQKVATEIYGKEIYKINSILHERFEFNFIERSSSNKMNVNIANNSVNISRVNATMIDDGPVNMIGSDESIKNFYHMIFDYIVNGTILKNEDLLTSYRNIGFITLKTLFYPTMKNVYLPEKNDKMVIHIQNIVKNLIFIMNERVGMNKIYVDLATEFFHSLMMNASMLTSNSCKQQIKDFFLEPDFFNMSKKCLRFWKDIIKEYAHYNQDVIIDLLNTPISSSFFSKGNDKDKIKALRRVSFILYSCNKDTYSSKLGLILEKVKEVITNNSENPPLESEIFLMIRIMFLRFSHENLVEMLRYLWPIIFSELVNIISGKKKSNPLDLSLSSLKLIELLSLANMDEFCLYQWIFILDTCDSNKMNPENQVNIIKSLMDADPKTFRPYIMELVKDFNKNPDLVMDLSTKKYDEYDKRGLILQTQKLSDKNEQGDFVSRLFHYIALMNNFRTKIDWDAVENVIESDFLNN